MSTLGQPAHESLQADWHFAPYPHQPSCAESPLMRSMQAPIRPPASRNSRDGRLQESRVQGILVSNDFRVPSFSDMRTVALVPFVTAHKQLFLSREIYGFQARQLNHLQPVPKEGFWAADVCFGTRIGSKSTTSVRDATKTGAFASKD